MLSGTSSNGVHHSGILEGWFGAHWWNGRAFVLLITTLFVFVPLACIKRVGKCFLLLCPVVVQCLASSYHFAHWFYDVKKSSYNLLPVNSITFKISSYFNVEIVE